MQPRILILGTGLIGSSLGLALQANGFTGELLGYDRDTDELATAVRLGAVGQAVREAELMTPGLADIYVLATPVLPILDWLKRLAPVLASAQLVTDVGSTKGEIATLAATLYNGEGQAAFLPGHPMAGKESGGAALADAELFRGASWLFTPLNAAPTALETTWRQLVASIGANARDLEAARHDQLCAWVSHLPQYLSTALAALLEDTFANDLEEMAAVQAVGGRALRETTRLGASPYSMWRDVALTNTENVSATLLALEQRLQHMRENLRTPALRDEFATANKFRASKLG
jgi:prephenate dehydrogenase